MKIISTKLNPKDILPILRIINDSDRVDVIRNRIYEYLNSVSPRGHISMRNAVYALAFPTLRQLKLVIGRGKYIRLDADGQLLLETYDKQGKEEYMRLLAKTILRADTENAAVMGILSEGKKSSFTKEEIVRKLLQNDVDTSADDDRLVKWLRILKFVGLIEWSDNLYSVNHLQINALQKNANVSSKSFNLTLIDSYEKLMKERRGNPYIPIPLIEREVCSRLSDRGFTTFDFRKRLVSLKGRKIDGYRLFFSKPGAREPNGLRINGQYYYYVALFKE